MCWKGIGFSSLDIPLQSLDRHIWKFQNFSLKVWMDRDVAGLESVEACSKMGSDRACAHRNGEKCRTGAFCFTSGFPPFAWISHTCSVPLEQMLPKRSNQERHGPQPGPVLSPGPDEGHMRQCHSAQYKLTPAFATRDGAAGFEGFFGRWEGERVG